MEFIVGNKKFTDYSEAMAYEKAIKEKEEKKKKECSIDYISDVLYGSIGNLFVPNYRINNKSYLFVSFTERGNDTLIPLAMATDVLCNRIVLDKSSKAGYTVNYLTRCYNKNRLDMAVFANKDKYIRTADKNIFICKTPYADECYVYMSDSIIDLIFNNKSLNEDKLSEEEVDKAIDDIAETLANGIVESIGEFFGLDNSDKECKVSEKDIDDAIASLRKILK